MPADDLPHTMVAAARSVIRIGYVINSMEGGGAQLIIPAVTHVLRAHGADVRVFALTRRDGHSIASLLDAGLEVEVRDGGERDQFAAYRWLVTRLRQWRASAVWTSLTRATLLGELVGARLRLPVVSWQHNAWLRPNHLRMLRATRRLSALWVADSTSVAAFAAARLSVPVDRLMTWPLFRADPDAPRAVAWAPGEIVRLGSLGRLKPAKGYDVLIDALVRLRQSGFTPPAPFSVEIAGDGNRRAQLEARVREAGVALSFTGFCHDPNVFLAGLHVYLQPSRREGLCIAAHEAMQAGLPLIVSETGEMPYSVGSGEGAGGIIVPPDDAEALAAGLAMMLNHPERLAAIGNAGRSRLFARLGPEAFDEAGAAVMSRLRVAGCRNA